MDAGGGTLGGARLRLQAVLLEADGGVRRRDGPDWSIDISIGRVLVRRSDSRASRGRHGVRVVYGGVPTGARLARRRQQARRESAMIYMTTSRGALRLCAS